MFPRNCSTNVISFAIIATSLGVTSGVAQAQLVLEEVIVSAQKRDESVQDIPVSVTAISASMIEELGIEDTTDVVRVSPSLTVVQSNNKTNSAFSIRGIGTNVFGIGVEQAVAMVVDDVAMPQQGQSILGLSDVERIEVLRGPQSTLFGKAASAGVISITTRAPSEEFEGTVALTATDEESYEIQGTVSGPITDNLAYRLTGLWSDRDGYIDNLTTGEPDLGGGETEQVRGKLRWHVSDTIVADLGAHYYKEDDNQCCGRIFSHVEEGAQFLGFIPEDFLVGITPSDYNKKIRIDTVPDSTTDSSGANLRLSFDIGEFNLLSITAYDEWEYENNEDVDFSDLDVLKYISNETGGFSSNSWRELDFFSQEFRLLSPIHERYDYLIGMYYSDMEIERGFFRNLPIAPSDYEASAKTEYLGLFGQLNWRFAEKWSTSLGLRYFEEEIEAAAIDFAVADPQTIAGDDKDDDIVGKLALQYFVNDDTMLFASYSRGYKGQAFDITASFNEFKAENPAEPEISDAFEVGFKSTLLDQRLQLNVTAFHTTYEDFQVQGSFIDEDGIGQFELLNAGELITQGVELEATTLLSETLTLTFNGAYMDTEVNDFDGARCWPGQTEEEGCIDNTQDIDGGVLPNAPEWRYALIFDYRQPLNSVSFDFFGNIAYTWQDEVQFGIDQNPSDVEDAYGVTNIRAGITDKNGRYELTAFVNNAFDEQYAGERDDLSPAYGNDTVLFHVLPRNSQRYWGLKVRFNF